MEIPNWDQESLEQIREALITVGVTMNDSRGVWGEADEIDPVKHLLGTATAWGGSPGTDEFVLWRTPEQNDGDTPHTLTVDDIPVTGYWSVTVYNSDCYLKGNEYDAYAINNVTAERDNNGDVTIHFAVTPINRTSSTRRKGGAIQSDSTSRAKRFSTGAISSPRPSRSSDEGTNIDVLTTESAWLDRLSSSASY